MIDFNRHPREYGDLSQAWMLPRLRENDGERDNKDSKPSRRRGFSSEPLIQNTTDNHPDIEGG